MSPAEDAEGQMVMSVIAGYILGVLTSPDALIPLGVRGDPTFSPDGTTVSVPFEAKTGGSHLDVTVTLVE